MKHPRIRTPAWWHRLSEHAGDILPKVYGPRGMVMLGKAMMCVCFGISYLGILGNKPQPGLVMVTNWMPLEAWAVVWFVVAFMLASSAFKVDQSRALGAVAALLSLWAMCFIDFFRRVPVLPDGTPNTAFVSAALLASMALSAAGCARLLNHAPSHSEVVQKPGDTTHE